MLIRSKQSITEFFTLTSASWFLLLLLEICDWGCGQTEVKKLHSSENTFQLIHSSEDVIPPPELIVFIVTQTSTATCCLFRLTCISCDSFCIICCVPLNCPDILSLTFSRDSRTCAVSPMKHVNA